MIDFDPVPRLVSVRGKVWIGYFVLVLALGLATAWMFR